MRHYCYSFSVYYWEISRLENATHVSAGIEGLAEAAKASRITLCRSLLAYKTCRTGLMEGRVGGIFDTASSQARKILHCCSRRRRVLSCCLSVSCRSPNKLLTPRVEGYHGALSVTGHIAGKKSGTRKISCASFVPYGREAGAGEGWMVMQDLRSKTWYCRCSNHCWSWCSSFSLFFSPNRRTTPWSLFFFYLTRTP